MGRVKEGEGKELRVSRENGGLMDPVKDYLDIVVTV